MTLNKLNTIKSLNFLINSVLNLEKYLNNPNYYIDNFMLLLNKLNHHITDNDIAVIDEFAQELILKKNYFGYMDFSKKLTELWKLLNEIYQADPNKVVECVTYIIDKRIPRNLVGKEKEEFMTKLTFKFIGKTKKVNSGADMSPLLSKNVIFCSSFRKRRVEG